MVPAEGIESESCRFVLRSLTNCIFQPTRRSFRVEVTSILQRPITHAIQLTCCRHSSLSAASDYWPIIVSLTSDFERSHLQFHTKFPPKANAIKVTCRNYLGKSLSRPSQLSQLPVLSAILSISHTNSVKSDSQLNDPGTAFMIWSFVLVKKKKTSLRRRGVQSFNYQTNNSNKQQIALGVNY